MFKSAKTLTSASERFAAAATGEVGKANLWPRSPGTPFVTTSWRSAKETHLHSPMERTILMSDLLVVVMSNFSSDPKFKLPVEECHKRGY